MDAILSHFQTRTYSKAILFVDNAGADVLLGMVPFARELLKRGSKVRGRASGRHGVTLLLVCGHTPFSMTVWLLLVWHCITATAAAGLSLLLPPLPSLLPQVVLAANAGPTINDITAAELQPLLASAAEGDALLRQGLGSGQLKVLSSGNDMPVIDLSQVGGSSQALRGWMEQCFGR